MRTPNVSTADWPEASVPTVAWMLPAAPAAGAVTVPIELAAGTAAWYVVSGGVASSSADFGS